MGRIDCSSSESELTRDEWRTIANYARNVHLKPQPMLLAKMRAYYDKQPNVPRMKRCQCTYHDIAVYLTIYIRPHHDENTSQNNHPAT